MKKFTTTHLWVFASTGDFPQATLQSISGSSDGHFTLTVPAGTATVISVSYGGI